MSEREGSLNDDDVDDDEENEVNDVDDDVDVDEEVEVNDDNDDVDVDVDADKGDEEMTWTHRVPKKCLICYCFVFLFFWTRELKNKTKNIAEKKLFD